MLTIQTSDSKTPLLLTSIQCLAERLEFLEYMISWKQSRIHRIELENLKSDPTTSDLVIHLLSVRISMCSHTYTKVPTQSIMKCASSGRITCLLVLRSTRNNHSGCFDQCRCHVLRLKLVVNLLVMSSIENRLVKRGHSLNDIRSVLPHYGPYHDPPSILAEMGLGNRHPARTFRRGTSVSSTPDPMYPGLGGLKYSLQLTPFL